MNLKQSTAVTIKFGPFLDDGDGKTAETGLTIQKADIRVSKNGGNMAAANSDQGEADAGAAHDELGYYDVSLDTTDTGTLGRLKVMCHKSGALPVWSEFMVMPANVWDSLHADDKLDVNVVSQDNIDFGALQKASLNAATPASVVGAVGSVTAGVTLADDAITAAKFDESTAFPLKSADTGVTAVARTGADSDTLETLSDQIDNTSTHSAADVLSTSVAGTDAGDLGYAIEYLFTLLTTGDGAKVGSFATDAITAAAVKADAVTKIQNGLSTFDASSDEVNVGAINGANVTESSAGNLAAAFSFFFDEGTPTKTLEDIGAVTLSEQDIADIGAAAASGLLSGGTFIKVDAAGRVYTKSFGRRLT